MARCHDQHIGVSDEGVVGFCVVVLQQTHANVFLRQTCVGGVAACPSYLCVEREEEG